MLYHSNGGRRPFSLMIMTGFVPKLEPPPYISMAREFCTHKEYYMEGGNLVIEVDSILFRVWDFNFRRHSEFFEREGEDQLPALDGVKPGTDNLHPFCVKDVKSEEFERLLWILYPQTIGKYRASTAEDWVTILNLATRWAFTDVRELAIKELEGIKFDAVEKLGIMQKYHIDKQWGYSAIIELCSRTHPLSVEEGHKLGIEISINVARVREKLEKWGRMKAPEVKKAANETFELQEPK